MVDVHPDRPAFRGVQADQPISLEADPSFEELETAGATLLKSDKPHTVLDDFFLVSGEIPRKTSYEDGIHGGLRFNDSTAQWEEDTLIMEERYVMCNLKGMIPHSEQLGVRKARSNVYLVAFQIKVLLFSPVAVTQAS